MFQSLNLTLEQRNVIGNKKDLLINITYTIKTESKVNFSKWYDFCSGISTDIDVFLQPNSNKTDRESPLGTASVSSRQTLTYKISC